MSVTVYDWESLQIALEVKEPCRIEGFDKEFAFLSNFYPSLMEVERMEYLTLEHAYQALKTKDRTERLAIAALESPGAAKRAGRKVTLRDDWEEIKLEVMKNLVRLKFTLHEDLKEKLLDTGNAYLEETNTWRDRFWGVCKGEGQNHLGRILMEVRDELRKQSA